MQIYLVVVHCRQRILFVQQDGILCAPIIVDNKLIAISIVDVAKSDDWTLGGLEYKLLGSVSNHGDDGIRLVNQPCFCFEKGLGDAPG